MDEDLEAGVWIVYGYDMMAYPIAVFEDEVKAYRYKEKLGYGNVKFWKFETEWTND